MAVLSKGGSGKKEPEMPPPPAPASDLKEQNAETLKKIDEQKESVDKGAALEPRTAPPPAPALHSTASLLAIPRAGTYPPVPAPSHARSALLERPIPRPLRACATRPLARAIG